MRPVIADLIIAVLIVSAFAGTILLYNQETNDENPLITLNQETPPTNPPSTELATTLSEAVVKNNLVLVTIPPEAPTVNVQYDSLWINGSVTNTGHTLAANTGLHVEAYASDGSLKINMTVPLATAVYGTDKQTNSFIANFPDYALTLNGVVCRDYAPPDSLPLGQAGSLSLGSLDAGQTVYLTLAIYHEGAVASWTVTPVWTNTP